MADVLVCASSIHGHVTPMLEVAAHLRESGHAVRMTTGSRFADRVSGAGVEFVPLRGAADFDDTDLDRAFPGRADAKGIAKVKFDVSHLFIRTMRDQFDVVTAELRRRPADVVVFETTFMGVGPLLARPGPRPQLVGCGLIPLTLSSPHVPPFGPGIPYAAGTVARLRNRALSGLIRNVVMAPQQREAQKALADCVPGARLSGYFMDGVVHLDAFLQLSVEALDYPRPDLPPNVSYVGPVLPQARGHADLPDWWADLDGSLPVVLVTQGTLDIMDLDRLLGPSLRGLSDEDVLVVAVTGGPPVEQLGPLPENARAARFIPFDLLMPLVSVMVTNGGFGGVHQALAHDVPLVVGGDTEEKAEIAARVDWAGVGVSLRTGTPAPEKVRDAVRAVLGQAAYRDKARLVGADIRRSDALGRVAAEVDARSAGGVQP
ncbi:MAG TPA: nucleotide disphospho-sugar-binding domain-containing protein [Humibacillus xanthopallidus]|nr:nucleotide disphospho-sugar-binding domain-containing protein [Humibacillus xanthopallidus]